MRTLKQSWVESKLLDTADPLHDATVIHAQNALEHANEEGFLDDLGLLYTSVMSPPLDNFVIEFQLSAHSIGFDSTVNIMFHFVVNRHNQKAQGDEIKWWVSARMFSFPQIVASAAIPAGWDKGYELANYSFEINANGYVDSPPTVTEIFTLPMGMPSDLVKELMRTMIVCAFVLNLMHCKNVHMIESEPTRRQKRMAKKHNKPIYRYHVLKIRTGKGMYDALPDTKATGVKMSHHICRGHFRTYTDDAPLFGKYTGTYWVPSHARGRESVGKVDKDYKID